MFLLIDNYDSFTYNLSQALLMLGEAITVIRNDQIAIAEIEKMNLQGIILSPGPGVLKRLEYASKFFKNLVTKLPFLASA